MASPIAQRLAVCSWSIQPTDPNNLVTQLQAIGISRVQIALDSIRERPGVWGKILEVFRRNNITLVSGMFGTIGEDYSTLESIRRTGGVAPDATWNENWRNIETNAVIARQLRLKLVTFHAGFLPQEESDPAFKKLYDRVTLIADRFAAKGIDIGFETGQETAETLRAFLIRLNRPNVGVNFDPANMILYDKGNPIDGLRALGPWLKQCHIKDAVRTKSAGTWGEEVVVGLGDVNWQQFFSVLRELKFNGDLCIEREAGPQRVSDISAARKFLESLAT
jgi:sugar phosphate isomerase/epimerase